MSKVISWFLHAQLETNGGAAAAEEEEEVVAAALLLLWQSPADTTNMQSVQVSNH